MASSTTSCSGCVNKSLERLFQTHQFPVFRHVAMKPQYFLQPRDKDPNKGELFVGDYLGQPAATRWRVNTNCQDASGQGSVFQWFHHYLRCPASNTCTGVPQSELQKTRTPALDYPDHGGLWRSADR